MGQPVVTQSESIRMDFKEIKKNEGISNLPIAIIAISFSCLFQKKKKDSTRWTSMIFKKRSEYGTTPFYFYPAEGDRKCDRTAWEFHITRHRTTGFFCLYCFCCYTLLLMSQMDTHSLTGGALGHATRRVLQHLQPRPPSDPQLFLLF